ncbi:MAG: hypothetical protein ACYC4I_01870 [Minisyncoccota bacterium]
MLEHKKAIYILVGALGVAVVAVVFVFYTYKNSKNVQQTSSSLTNAEEVVLQQQIGRIIASKKESDCATLMNKTYRTACEKSFHPVQSGTELAPLPLSSYPKDGTSFQGGLSQSSSTESRITSLISQ